MLNLILSECTDKLFMLPCFVLHSVCKFCNLMIKKREPRKWIFFFCVHQHSECLSKFASFLSAMKEKLKIYEAERFSLCPCEVESQLEQFWSTKISLISSLALFLEHQCAQMTRKGERWENNLKAIKGISRENVCLECLNNSHDDFYVFIFYFFDLNSSLHFAFSYLLLLLPTRTWKFYKL